MASYRSEVSTSVGQKENSYEMKSSETSVVITPAIAQLIMKELQKIQNSLTETIEGRQRISMRMDEMTVQKK